MVSRCGAVAGSVYGPSSREVADYGVAFKNGAEHLSMASKIINLFYIFTSTKNECLFIHLG